MLLQKYGSAIVLAATGGPGCPDRQWADSPMERWDATRAPCGLLGGVISYNHMVVGQRERQRTDRLFHALSDATRRDIVVCAMHGDHSVSAIARRYPISLAAVQKHVAVLEEADLVSKHRHGREQLVRTNHRTLQDARRILDELEAVWRSRMDRFGDVLADDLDQGGST
jgi:DNA-binding transcriptional ArsR family regulator